MRLQGDPTQRFAHRFLLTTARTCVVDVVALTTLLVAWPLFARRIHIPLSGHLWMAAQCCNYAAQIVMHRRGARPAWRERCAMAVRLNSFGLFSNAGSMVGKLWLDQTPPVTGSFVLARHALLMLFSSGAVTQLLLQAEVVRFSWALPVQLLVAVNCMAFNPTMCSAAALAHPVAQQQTHHLFQLLELANFSLLPVAAHVQPTAECAAVLGYFQLSLGLVLPLLAQAALESWLFREHQRQRQQLGMSANCGAMAWLYSSVSGLGEALDGVTLAVALWMALGMLWKLSVAVAYAQTGGG